MYKEIMVTVDLADEQSWGEALKVAHDMAKTYDANLNIMAVVPDYGMSFVGSYFPANYEKDLIEKTKSGLKKLTHETFGDTSVKLRHIVAHGTVYKEIIRAIRKVGIDLVVMRSHRPELKDYLLGPNAARVVRHAPCSVLVIR